MTAYLESTSGLMVPRTLGVSDSAHRAAIQLELVENRLADLERQLADDHWQRLTEQGAREFTRDALRDNVDLCRVMAIKNPLIKRAVEVAALYVWGQDVQVSAADKDVQAVVDRFDQDNADTLTGQQISHELDVELRVTGNLFIAFFPDPITGSVRARQVPMEEIARIVTNPDDRAQVWYYLREWSEESLESGTPTARKAFYPHIAHQPDAKLASVKVSGIGDVEIRWQSPMDHVKTGGFPHWKWGIPEVYAAIDWARAYKKMLEDDATRSAGLARWVWQVETPGGKREVDAITQRLSTTLGAGRSETNPPPAAGSVAVAGGGNKLSPFNMSSAVLPPDHSKNARLMVASAVGLSDTYLSGDVDQSSLATSQTMERPIELMFTEDRRMWQQKRKRWYAFAIECDLAASRGILPKAITEKQREVKVTWPDLLEDKAADRVGAVTAAKEFLPKKLAARLVMNALEVEDIDTELANWEAEQTANAATAAAIAQKQPPAPVDPNAPPVKPTETKRTKGAALDLAAALAFFDKVNPDVSGLLDADVSA